MACVIEYAIDVQLKSYVIYCLIIRFLTNLKEAKMKVKIIVFIFLSINNNYFMCIIVVDSFDGIKVTNIGL